MKPTTSTSLVGSATLDPLPVRSQGEELTVSSRDFAAGLGIQHKNLLATIRQHQPAIETDFGRIAFEAELGEIDSAFQTPNLPAPLKRSTKPLTVAYLTEDQALFVGTLSRNSQRVVAFKSVLVRSFAQARRQQPAPAIDVQAGQAQRLAELERQVGLILATQQQATRSLLELPRSSEVVPEETTRMNVQRIVNGYCQATGKPQQDVWRMVYERLYYRYSVRIRAYKKRSDRESWLDVAERTGHIDKLYAIVSAELH